MYILIITSVQAKSFATKTWLVALRDVCRGAICEYSVSNVENAVAGYESAAVSLSVS